MKASNLMVNIASRRRICNGKLFSPIAGMHADCGIVSTQKTKSWRNVAAAPVFIIKADSEQNFRGTMLHRKRGHVTISGSAELASETEIGLFPSRRLKYGVEREMSALTQQRSRAPAQIFAKRKSHITNILINIARQISSFGGMTANKIGGIRGNIDAFTGWRIRNNEGIKTTWTTQMTGTTKTAEQNKTERMQNSGHQQQTNRIQHFAPAILFSAITNHILWEAKQ